MGLESTSLSTWVVGVPNGPTSARGRSGFDGGVEFDGGVQRVHDLTKPVERTNANDNAYALAA